MPSISNRPGRPWYRRRSRILLVAFVASLAVAVPVAWATFIDVPPDNPFYADINALQGAGITAGCGGGNFCPTDNITRQAEAAFVHRTAPRVAFAQKSSVALGPYADLGVLTISVPGLPGNTQFVYLTGSVTTHTCSGPPCTAPYYINREGFGRVGFFHYNTNATTGDLVTGAVTAVAAVPSGTTQTFEILATRSAGTALTGYGDLSAITAPFGSGGANVLSASQSSSGAGPAVGVPGK